MKFSLFLLFYFVLFSITNINTTRAVENDTKKASDHESVTDKIDSDISADTIRDDILIADIFLDYLFHNSLIKINNTDIKKSNNDSENIDIDIDVEFDLTHLFVDIDDNIQPVVKIPSYNDFVSTGLDMSFYFFANNKEKPILRFISSKKGQRSELLKKYIDKNIFRYLIIQIDENHFDQIFLSSRSGISLYESFKFSIPRVPVNLMNNNPKLEILITDKKRPRHSSTNSDQPRIIYKRNYPLNYK